MTRSKLSIAQQRARFGGLTTAEATKLRDRVLAGLSAEAIAAARAAYRALDAEGGQPWQWPQHPEAVRFHLMRLLGEGVPLPEAIDRTRTFAMENDQC